jgi:hypothetical protein
LTNWTNGIGGGGGGICEERGGSRQGEREREREHIKLIVVIASL